MRFPYVFFFSLLRYLECEQKVVVFDFASRVYISLCSTILQLVRFCVLRANIDSYALFSFYYIIIDLPGKPEVVVEVSGCNVTVKWTTPPWKSCPILFYTIEFTGEQTLQDNKKWATINVTDPTVKKQELMLNCTTTYVFRVKAWNDLGGGSLSTKQSATTGGRSTQADDGGEGDASMIKKVDVNQKTSEIEYYITIT